MLSFGRSENVIKQLIKTDDYSWISF